MKNKSFNIYKDLQQNNLKTIIWTVSAALTIISCFVFTYKIYLYQLHQILVIDAKGSVLPIRWEERKKNLTIEVQSHVALFCRYYYSFDGLNQEYQHQKAGYLIFEEDKTRLDDFYQKRFQAIKKYQLVQKCLTDSLKISVNGEQEPHTFSLLAQVEVIRGDTKDIYALKASGNIAYVSAHFPLNPHGFLIYNYAEQMTKLQSDIK